MASDTFKTIGWRVFVEQLYSTAYNQIDPKTLAYIVMQLLIITFTVSYTGELDTWL